MRKALKTMNLYATRLMEGDNDSIENSPLDNNEVFLQNSWENLENNEDVDEDINDNLDSGLQQNFTMVRDKKKKKKLKQASG